MKVSWFSLNLDVSVGTLPILTNMKIYSALYRFLRLIVYVIFVWGMSKAIVDSIGISLLSETYLGS